VNDGELGGCRGDGGISISPVVAAAGEHAHGATIAAHDQPSHHPVGPGRRLDGNGGKQGGKAAGKDALRANSLEMAACREPPQLSCCRCVSRIATSATPKRNRMVRLITLITIKGMFSRYRTSAPPNRSNALPERRSTLF
jgi:hypothetical protein